MTLFNTRTERNPGGKAPQPDIIRRTYHFQIGVVLSLMLCHLNAQQRLPQPENSGPPVLSQIESSDRVESKPRDAQSGTSSKTVDDFSHAHGTVVVGVALSEGLVLAADSRIVNTGDNGFYRVVSDYTSKGFIAKFALA